MVTSLAISQGKLVAGGNFTMAGGKVSSRIASVFLNAVPPLEVSNGRASVYFRNVPAGEFRVERTTDFETWDYLATRYAGETGGIDFVDENAPASAAYYRAMPVDL